MEPTQSPRLLVTEGTKEKRERALAVLPSEWPLSPHRSQGWQLGPKCGLVRYLPTREIFFAGAWPSHPAHGPGHSRFLPLGRTRVPRELCVQGGISHCLSVYRRHLCWLAPVYGPVALVAIHRALGLPCEDSADEEGASRARPRSTRGRNSQAMTARRICQLFDHDSLLQIVVFLRSTSGGPVCQFRESCHQKKPPIVVIGRRPLAALRSPTRKAPSSVFAPCCSFPLGAPQPSTAAAWPDLPYTIGCFVHRSFQTQLRYNKSPRPFSSPVPRACLFSSFSHFTIDQAASQETQELRIVSRAYPL